MALIVQKYGGTSVGSVPRIKAVAERIAKTAAEGHQLVVVVSAMSGQTNELSELAKQITDNPCPRELDALLASGEQVSMALLSMCLVEMGLKARSYTGAQAQIVTDEHYNKARIIGIDNDRIQKDLDKNRIVVIAGYQGVTQTGDITTLGRGGSDTTAVAMAALLNADECQIYTDVDGVYTTDPRIEPNARRLEQVSFDEMIEMASLGAKVLQIRAVEFAGKYNVPLRVLSSFTEGTGTLITYEEALVEEAVVTGVTYNRNEAKLTVLGVPDQPGIAAQILGPVSDANIEIDMIIQNMAADKTTDFSFTVQREDYEDAKDILAIVAKKVGAQEVRGDDKIAKLSIVGVGMRSHAGVASTMFRALADANINIQLIATSEIKVSVLVDEKNIETGVRTLHQVFGLEVVPKARTSGKEVLRS